MTTSTYRLDRFDLADRSAFLADLEAGKIGLSWRPFVLVFAGTPAADIERALEAVTPYGRGEAGTYPAARGAAERFAARCGAEDPALLIRFLGMVSDAADKPEPVCEILQNLPY